MVLLDIEMPGRCALCELEWSDQSGTLCIPLMASTPENGRPDWCQLQDAEEYFKNMAINVFTDAKSRKESE